MIESIEKVLPKYLSADLIAETVAVLKPLSPVQVAVYDLSGNAFFLSSSAGPDCAFPARAEADPHLAALFEEARNTLTDVVERRGSEMVTAVVPIATEDGCVGLLAASLRRAESDGDDSAFVPALTAYARLLAESLNGQRSTADLSTELLDRYEELSLVYALAGLMDLSKPVDTILDTILETAADTLAADALLLHVPGYQFGQVFPDEEARPRRWESLFPELMARIVKEPPSVAANNVADDPVLGPLSGGYAHLAAAHVEVDGDFGLILLARRSPEERLYMGDVRLLESIAQQMSAFLSNIKVHAARRQLFDSVVFGLARLAESRDPETGEHLHRVSEYCRMLAEQLRSLDKYREVISREFIEEVVRCSPLHDIGKVGIPDAVLLKPGKLTEEEFEVIKTHSVIGGKTLEEVEERLHWGASTFLTVGRQIAYSHHEKWNGGGYLSGMAGETIPLAARIMALADVYDALTSKRCYKEGFSHEKACGIILEERGLLFDPDIVDAFTVIEKEFDRIRGEYAEV